MPQRFLRPAITNSERWNSVSWEAQSFYIRLLTIVDDFGRCDGRASVLCGHCFSVWNERNPQQNAVTPQHVARMLQQLADNSLVEIYESEGKKVLQFVQWQERIRSEKSKWPQRDSNPLRNPAESCGILPPSPSPSPSPASGDAGNSLAEIPSLKEVIDRGAVAGVPSDFCEHYHAVCTERHRWLVKSPTGEKVIGWQSELIRWWSRDRHNWHSSQPAQPIKSKSKADILKEVL